MTPTKPGDDLINFSTNAHTQTKWFFYGIGWIAARKPFVGCENKRQLICINLQVAFKLSV